MCGIPWLAPACRHRSLLFPRAVATPSAVAARSPLSGRDDHSPDSRGETECTQHSPDDGESAGSGEPCLGREGSILGLLGRLLGPSHCIGYLTYLWQPHWELQVQ